MFRKWSLAGRIFAGNLVLILLVAGAAMIWQAFDIRNAAYQTATLRTHGVAATIAANPEVAGVVTGKNPSATLQPMARTIMDNAHVDFVTIMTREGVRITHANASEIGKQYLGDVSHALAGEDFTETYTGTLGPSVRSIVPIRDAGGKIVGMVSVGLSVASVETNIASRLGSIALLAAALCVGAGLLAFLLGRYLRARTNGLGPETMAQVFAYYESVLHSVREGVMLLDRNSRPVLFNEQALTLLGASPTPGKAPELRSLPIERALLELLQSGRSVRDEAFLTEDRVLLVTQEPAQLPEQSARRRPRSLGTVVTLRDRTEVTTLGTELATMKSLSDALRAQGHEHANRVHLLVSLMELGRIQEALDLATKDLRTGQRLADQLIASTEEPIISALVMGKSAEAHERSVDLDVDVSAVRAPLEFPAEELVTIIGNLLDNAIDAAAPHGAGGDLDLPSGATAGTPTRGRVRLVVSVDETAATFEVTDSGPGMATEAAESGLVFESGFTTKESSLGRGVGLALVRQTVRRLGGSITVYKTAAQAPHNPERQNTERVENQADYESAPPELCGAHFVVALPRGNPGMLGGYS